MNFQFRTTSEMDQVKKKFKNVLKKNLKVVRMEQKIQNDHLAIEKLIREHNLNALQLYLWSLLDKLKALDKFQIFHRPVNAHEVPTYYKIIKEPMCFEEMERNLLTHKYIHLDLFEADFKLIISNCLQFNKKDDYFYRAGESLGEQAVDVFQVARQTFNSHIYLQPNHPKFELKVVYHNANKEYVERHESSLDDDSGGDDEDDYLRKLLSKFHESNVSTNELLYGLLETLKKHDKLGIFSQPVHGTRHSEINIKDSMNFQMMKLKLDQHEYDSLASFENDFQLICSNYFNNPIDKRSYRAAKNLQKKGTRVFEAIKKSMQQSQVKSIFNELMSQTEAKFDKYDQMSEDLLNDLMSLKQGLHMLSKLPLPSDQYKHDAATSTQNEFNTIPREIEVNEQLHENNQIRTREFQKIKDERQNFTKKLEIKMTKLDTNEVKYLKTLHPGLKIKF